jgi:Protein of unknown function (DUF1553)/Protein of unknown function (DUF1549)
MIPVSAAALTFDPDPVRTGPGRSRGRRFYGRLGLMVLSWVVTATSLIQAADLEEVPSPAPIPSPKSQIANPKPHWAFQPVRLPVLPEVKNPAWVRTPVDRFILARLEGHGLAPAAMADKRTLLRRATYDLLGLPPAPEEVDAFLADPSPDAFSKVVERLLGSPHYGEQWGRHWLDVVRYADTAGENSDHPVPQAWRYRNWVIQAFNEDLPYDEFIREQIAGDLLAAQGPPEKYSDRVVATGYLTIARRFGHEIDKDMHLTLEDTLDTMGKSVLGLTLGCARCHDHKYDPITTRDYYGLYGILDSTRYAYPGCEPNQLPHDLVPLLSPADTDRRMQPYRAKLVALDAEVKRWEAKLAGQRAAFDISAAGETLGSGDLSPQGDQTFAVGNPLEPATLVRVKKGEMLELEVLPKANHGADSTAVEWEIAETDNPDGSNRVWNVTKDLLADFESDGSGAQFRDSYGNQAVWHAFDLVPAPTLFTRHVRDAEKTPGLQVWRGADDTPLAFINLNTQTVHFVTITMPARCVALHPGPRGGVALAWESPHEGTVTVRGRVFKIDPGGDGVAWKVERRPGLGTVLAGQKAIVRALTEAKKRRDEFAATKPSLPMAYAVAEGKAANARVQKRGDPKDLGEEVPRKFLDVLGGQVLPAGCTNSGRLELAQWLTSPANPLTARVMVNRIWQHHFGRGLVATPNDFGTRGQPPTHPDLLDYLAAEFIRSGWSVKALHRLIMLSAAYQMSSEARRDLDGHAVSVPHQDELYASFPSRRLSAEEIRDSLLVAGGNLDATPGQGHPFPPQSTWSFTQHNPFSAVYETHRRSVYLMTQRIKRHPFLALFDGPDPNASTAVRDRTVVATQALFFMNDPFLHAQAGKFAERILAGADSDGARLDLAYRLLFGRCATPVEKADAGVFFRDYTEALGDQPPEKKPVLAWAAYARVLFSDNEFIYVD